MAEEMKLKDGTIVPEAVLQAINTIFETQLLKSERGNEYYFIPSLGMPPEIVTKGLNCMSGIIPMNIEPQSLFNGQVGYRIRSMENHLRACEFVILLNKQKLSNMFEMPQYQENVPVPGGLTSSVQEVPEQDVPNQNVDPEEAFYGGNKKVFLTTLAHYFKVVSVPTQSGEETLFLAPKTKLLPITSQEGKAAQDMLNNAYYAIEGQPHPQFGRLYYTSRPECIEAFKKVAHDLNQFIQDPQNQAVLNKPVYNKSVLTATSVGNTPRDPLKRLHIPGATR